MYNILAVASTGITGSSPIIIFFMFVIITIKFLINKKIFISKVKNFYILILFSVSYSIFTYINTRNFPFLIFGGLGLTYYCGVMINDYYNGDEKNISKCIIAIAVGFFIHGMLNYIFNINSVGRNTIDFWSNTRSSATIQSTLFTMMLSIFIYVYIFSNKFIYKILYTIGFIIVCLYINILATRTPIIIAIIVAVIELLIYVYLNKVSKKTCIKVFGITVGILIVITTVTTIFINNNLFNVNSIIENSNLLARFGKTETASSDSSRLMNQYIGLKSIFKYPFGRVGDIGDLHYAHNMWLDAGKNAGLIPFLSLLLYTVNTFISVGKLLKNKNYSIKYKILVTSIYIGVNLNFVVEPILDGNVFFFLMVVVINGMIDSQIFNLKEKKHNESITNNKYNITFSSTGDRIKVKFSRWLAKFNSK